MIAQTANEKFNQQRLMDSYISLIGAFGLYVIMILWVRHSIKSGGYERKKSLAMIFLLVFIWTGFMWKFFMNNMLYSLYGVILFALSGLATIYLIYLHSTNKNTKRTEGHETD